jgi:hypothetical protein
MHRLNRNMENETIMLRIVTIVTLFYLPATFVSTFFSTDIVKYQTDPAFPDGKFSSTALYRWLQVTLPLTILTVSAAYLGMSWAEKNAEARWFGDAEGVEPAVAQGPKRSRWHRLGAKAAQQSPPGP